MQNAKDLDPQKGNGPIPAPEQKLQAFVVPVPLFAQLIDLVRGNCTHQQADPVIQQCTQLQPQEITLRND